MRRYYRSVHQAFKLELPIPCVGTTVTRATYIMRRHYSSRAFKLGLPTPRVGTTVAGPLI
jgi:hypothetical protein